MEGNEGNEPSDTEQVKDSNEISVDQDEKKDATEENQETNLIQENSTDTKDKAISENESNKEDNNLEETDKDMIEDTKENDQQNIEPAQTDEKSKKSESMNNDENIISTDKVEEKAKISQEVEQSEINTVEIETGTAAKKEVEQSTDAKKEADPSKPNKKETKPSKVNKKEPEKEKIKSTEEKQLDDQKDNTETAEVIEVDKKESKSEQSKFESVTESITRESITRGSNETRNEESQATRGSTETKLDDSQEKEQTEKKSFASSDVKHSDIVETSIDIIGREEDDDDNFDDEVEEIIYEWEEELEEYDEPDIYPSEKDYKMVEEEVTDSEPEPEEECPAAILEVDEAETKEDGEQKGAEEGAEDEGKEKEEKQKEEAAQAEDGVDDEDKEEIFQTTQEEVVEEEVPKKKYKKVWVKKLIERPPKIHHDPSSIRNENDSDDPGCFLRPPFTFVYSFGYDCQRMANIHVLDDTTLMFMTGFVITFLNHHTGEKSYLRCLGGECFGALAIHPSKRLFAAAEKGKNPVIGIWSWPKQQLFRILREGTEKMFASINFSPDGKLLASQGGEPDYLITVWNWLAQAPILRVKSHAQDVYRVTFSKELAGRLTTSGLCHIKFWKMAYTFTGMKLKGEIGRFGKTELSDIEGYIEMADGKVLSGSEWGNLLVWENGLIVAEICMFNEIPCHNGIVRQILFVEGEFYTTGQDGYVRTWDNDQIDTSEIHTSDTNNKVPLKPLSTVCVSDKADIWSIVPDVQDKDSNNIFWFAQDGFGKIWKIDLSFLHTSLEPKPILSTHGGPIVACDTSCVTCLMATLGSDGFVRVFDYIKRKCVAFRDFSAPGSCLLWPSNILDPLASIIFVGFEDGTLRVLRISKADLSRHNLMPLSILLQYAAKPHSKSITCMSLDDSGQNLVTGSLDGTIFLFSVSGDNLEPIVFIDIPDWSCIRHLMWAKTEKEEEEIHAIRVVCDGGFLVDILKPEPEDIDNSVTYHYLNTKILRRFDFKSIKSELRHNEELERERIAEEKRQADIEEELRQRVESGLETQSQQDIRLMEEAEEREKQLLLDPPPKKAPWKPYIPPEPSPFLTVTQSIIDDKQLWVNMGKYDTGYLYAIEIVENEVRQAQKDDAGKPITSIPLQGTDDVPITCMVLSKDGNQVFMGMEDGRVRVQQLMYDFDFEELGPYWQEGAHDCIRGNITSLALDKDEAYMITTGLDGNCFLYNLLNTKEMEKYNETNTLIDFPKYSSRHGVKDIETKDALTLEVFKQVAKEMELLAIAKKNKQRKKDEIFHLRSYFHELLRKNNDLPEDVRLTPIETAISTDYSVRLQENIKDGLVILEKEMAWETERCRLLLQKVQDYFKRGLKHEQFKLFSFETGMSVSSYTDPQFPSFFQEALVKIVNQSTPTETISEIMDDDASSTGSFIQYTTEKPVKKKGMDKYEFQKLLRIWEKKQKRLRRQQVWKDFLATEPKGRELSEEDKAIAEAENTIGDMKLKSALDYKVPELKKLTVHRARKRLVKLEEFVHHYKLEFNSKLLRLKDIKIECIKKLKDLSKKLRQYQLDIPVEERLSIPEIGEMTYDECPQKYFNVSKKDVEQFKKRLEESKYVVDSAPTQDKSKGTKKETLKRKERMGKQVPSIPSINQSSTADRHSVSKGGDDPRVSTAADLGYQVELVNYPPTALEQQIKKYKLATAKFYEKYYLEQMEKEKFQFNCRLRLLYHRKIKLDYLLKIADQRMVLLTQEFILALKSETMEKTIEIKIAEASKEKKECATLMKNVTKKMDSLKKELDHINKRKNNLLSEVMNIIAKSPTFEKYLLRVYRKKAPKKRSITAIGEGSQVDLRSYDSDEDSDDSSDMDFEEDDDDDDDLDVDFPPPELNPDIYKDVSDIREKKYQIDVVEEEVKTKWDGLNTILNGYKTKSNNADKEINNRRAELDVFIKEKQARLNDLDIGISLKLHQIQHVDRNFTSTLVTETDTISRLKQRIPELKKEKHIQKGLVIEDKKKHMQLTIEKQKFLKRLDIKDKECDIEMEKKFGMVYSLEFLENFTTDPEIIALRSDLRGAEEESRVEVIAMEKEISKAEFIKLDHTDDNTIRLLCRAGILNDINSLTSSMDAYMKKLSSSFKDPMVAVESKKLRKLCLSQWKTINALNVEIAALAKNRILPLPEILRRSTLPYDN